MPAFVEISNLSKTYSGSPNPVVSDFSLDINRGEFWGLLGPNGAGKSTILYILCGLLSYDKGRVVVGGHEVNVNTKKLWQTIGFVPQDLALYESLTIAENLKIFGGIIGLSNRILTQRINELLSQLGLEDRRNYKIRACSGGMRRCVNLMITLLSAPQLLILDEPTVGVDVYTRETILSHLRTLNSSGITIIYTSHLLEEVQNICSNIALIDKGKLISNSTTEQLLSQYPDSNLEQIFIRLTRA